MRDIFQFIDMAKYMMSLACENLTQRASWRVLNGVFLLGLIGTGLASRAVAQEPTQTTSHPSSSASTTTDEPVSNRHLEEITPITPTILDPRIALRSDTGRMTRGHVDLSRYTTPGHCEQIVPLMRTSVWRTIIWDTIPDIAKLRDTIPTSVLEVARACASQFTAATTEPRELRNLAQLSLLVGNLSGAQEAIQRRLFLAHTASDSITIFRENAWDYLLARPMFIDSSEAAVRKLRGFGDESWQASAAAYYDLLSIYQRIFDRPNMHRTADSIIAIAHRLTSAQRDQLAGELGSAYFAKLLLALFEAPETRYDAFATLEREVYTLNQGNGRMREPGRSNWMQGLEELGKPAVSVDSVTWLNADSNTVRPTPGRLTWIVRIARNSGESAYRLYAMIRRFHDRYAALGLDIIAVTRTIGFTAWSYSGPQTAGQEIEATRFYFLEFLKLPALFAVGEVTFDIAPDGRRRYRGSAMKGPFCQLVDQRGIQIRCHGGDPEDQEAEFEAYIRRALGLKPF